MRDRAFLSTRKGLFELQRKAALWEPGPVHFMGEPVSVMLADARDGALYAALNLGHFGVPRRNRRKFRHSKSSPARSVSRSIIFPPLLNV